jgi:acetyltransferase-like isoleucine patch superfamily enzyme
MIFHIRLANAVRARLFRLLFARRFGSFGRGSLVVAPVGIEGAEHIHLGPSVYVAAQSCLAARPLTGGKSHLEIGEGCRIGRFNHIYATRRIVLGPKVLTANGVYISDNVHGYRDPRIAIMDQPIEQLGDVEIGEGSWLGHNVCVLGASVGKHCVVGANAVVTRDLPDYSVAVGAPAVVIRRLDADTGVWRPTHPDGEFVQQSPSEAGAPA